MRSAFQIIKGLLILLLCFFSFTWLIFHGSGHNISWDTDLSFIYTIGTLIALLIIAFILKHKYKGSL
jgi:cbb3-type cytochrome oxidase subunit 3